MYGQEEPAERTGLLMLEPHPQAIQVEDMFARQLLASVHTLSTDETLMCLHELLCGRIFESLLEAVGELQIFDERNKALIKGGESHPHISARVTVEEKAWEESRKWRRGLRSPDDVNGQTIVDEHEAEEASIGTEFQPITNKI
jgi:hypothetical protein